MHTDPHCGTVYAPTHMMGQYAHRSILWDSICTDPYDGTVLHTALLFGQYCIPTHLIGLYFTSNLSLGSSSMSSSIAATSHFRLDPPDALLFVPVPLTNSSAMASSWRDSAVVSAFFFSCTKSSSFLITEWKPMDSKPVSLDIAVGIALIHSDLDAIRRRLDSLEQKMDQILRILTRQ